MQDNLPTKILQKNVTRKEFLQFMGGSVVVILGMSNLIALMKQYVVTPKPTALTQPAVNKNRGFGASKFGV